jgi:hypothetical protein
VARNERQEDDGRGGGVSTISRSGIRQRPGPASAPAPRQAPEQGQAPERGARRKAERGAERPAGRLPATEPGQTTGLPRNARAVPSARPMPNAMPDAAAAPSARTAPRPAAAPATAQATAAVGTHRLPFVLLLCGLLGGALVSALVISTTLAEGAFQINSLQNSTTTQAKQLLTLQEQVAQAQSAQQIETRAAHLGMVGPGVLRFVDLKTGKTSTDADPGLEGTVPGYAP